jgi:hypothetical protein
MLRAPKKGHPAGKLPVRAMSRIQVGFGLSAAVTAGSIPIAFVNGRRRAVARRAGKVVDSRSLP